jgi:putative component of membrane protein insertase Oxa1/YidC/SpoIIIJ protein YidD
MTAFLPGLLLATRLAAASIAPPAEATPQLWNPDQAISFLLGGPSSGGAAAGAKPGGAAPGAWDGALGPGIARALFGTYHVVLSSQDLPTCGFSPSCSRFSQQAIGRCGPIQGALLTLDRLLRDHALARGFYPPAEGRLLRDDPDRYCLTAPE